MTNYKLDQAINEGDSMAVEAILRKKPKDKPYAVHQAIKHGQAAILDCLLNKLNVDPNHTFEDKIFLIEAINDEQLECVELLLEAGANPNINHKFGPMLGRAAHRGLLKNGEAIIVKLLVQYGADIQAVNAFNETALDIATIRFRNDAIRLQAVREALAATPMHMVDTLTAQPVTLLTKEVVNGAIAALPTEFTIEQLAAVLQYHKGSIDLPSETNSIWTIGVNDQKYADLTKQRLMD